MRVADELAPRMVEIRRWAMELFLSTEIRPIGLLVDASGRVAFDPASPMNQPQYEQQWDEEARQQLVAVGQERLSRLESDLQWIEDRFRSYYDLDSLDLTAMGGDLGLFRTAIRGELPPTNIADRIAYADVDLVAEVKDLIVESQWLKGDEPAWGGNAALAFREGFLKPFSSAAQLHQWYLRELGIVAQTYHDYVIEIGKALCQVADICIGELGGGAGVITEQELTDTVNKLSIASIVAGVLAFIPALAVPTGAASVGAGITSFALPFASEPVPKRYVSFTGGTLWEILDATRNALNTVEEVFTDGDVRLAAKLWESLHSGIGFANPSLTVNPPGVASRPGGPSFGSLSIDSVPGVPLNQDPVVVSIVDLHRAGTVCLAGAAAQYAQAAQELWGCEVAGSVRKFFPRSVDGFDKARDLLHSILNGTDVALEAAGDALVAIARNYRLSDERADEVLRQIDQFRTPGAVSEPARAGGV
jgi:hypothetical protein